MCECVCVAKGQNRGPRGRTDTKKKDVAELDVEYGKAVKTALALIQPTGRVRKI